VSVRFGGNARLDVVVDDQNRITLFNTKTGFVYYVPDVDNLLTSLEAAKRYQGEQAEVEARGCD
jgi:hypothetical protein